MGIKMKKKDTHDDSSRGSLTVEALLFLIPFMMAFCTLINAARFVQAEMLIHHAITQTAKQVSTYSYVLTKAEISSRIQETNRKSAEFQVTVEEAASSIQGFADALSNTDELFDGMISLIKAEGRGAVMTEIIGELSKRNIQSSISLLTEDPDEFLENLGIEDGMAGLNFDESEWLSNGEGKGDVKIIVSYTMKNVLFPDFDFGRHEFCQCAYTSIW